MSNKRIDTSKYEGHTRGPWRYYDDEEHDCWVFEGEDIEAQARVAFFAFTPCEGIAYLDDPDLNLMIDTPEILAELKRMYEREDALVSAIKELCDSEDSTGCSGDLTVVRLDPMLKLYELTS
tara:strand:+ start:83 stop:448 length:366 start_codon:yes stop_codon:yes gene_type:complete